jgi:hypothetical protein
VRGIAVVIAAALAAGLAFAVLLLGPVPGGRGALVSGEWWIPVFMATSIALGRLAAALLAGIPRIAAAVVAPPLAVIVLIAVKTLRWPDVPAVGDGFWVVLVWCAAAGLVGVALSRVRPLLPTPVRWFVATGIFALASVGATLVAIYGSFAAHFAVSLVGRALFSN